MPFALSNHCRIYYRLEGSAGKPLLVLVHALGTDHGLWDPQIAPLIRHFQVLRVDLRGHGASDAPPGEYTIPQLASDILAVVDSLGVQQFSYCGLSLGGMIGMRLGAHAGARIDKLVLANTSPRMADPALFETRRVTVLEQGMSSIAEAAMARFFSRPSASAESIRNTLNACGAIGYAGCCAAIRDMDHRPLLASIAAPTLVIAGNRDVSTPWEGHGDVLAANIPGAVEAHLDAAHLSNLERPAAFTRALLTFLDPHVGDGEAARRAALGDAHVDRSIANTTDFNRDFQDLITRYAWGAIWTRQGLDPRTRRLLVLAIAASMGRWEEFRLHVRSGLANELELADLEEVLLQTAIYAGVPAANTGFQIAAAELEELAK
jgi:3-oxoadipate enol-lactonase/4-carboxymuconolactone decarboxylase